MKELHEHLAGHLPEHLPEHLLERTRLHASGDPKKGSFILYWMRTAVRMDENPALEVALLLADQLGVSVLVYQAISPHYQYASDRHHTFMLEGARDVQAALNSRGISYAFHLATCDDTNPHLVTLSTQAAAVVTEEMPVDPPRRFLHALDRRTQTPILCVDTACVVPMQLVTQPYTRAFKFRSATEKLYAQRLTRAWPDIADLTDMPLHARPFDLQALPFHTLDLQDTNLAELVAKCAIDHSVGPVVDTPGGSKAGYDRWERFKKNGLNSYARRRNNALEDGVSRMSAYLHYGMVSPMRLARESADIDNPGAEKYLDELLIWRELAYVFCFHRTDHDQWSALPDWAQSTLEQHARDHRVVDYSWEQLARGVTDDSFWNAAQKSLLMQGELHNNVRMTWGKAILNWTSTPQRALALMIDLNHRYALDGRDPASYGGLLWCLGQFDRPFTPESNILGSVRPRSTVDHARRLDTRAYHTRVTTPRFDPVPKVAVVGAGISGLIAARTLADHGLPVTVFDKGRGVGGRMATRRIDRQPCFDHGAQYFTARDPRFQRYVKSWLQQGIVAPWPDSDQSLVVLKNGQIADKKIANRERDAQSSMRQASPPTLQPQVSLVNTRFVGNPSMNAVGKHLADGLDVRSAVCVGTIKSSQSRLQLFDNTGSNLGDFDHAIVAAPAPQTAALLASFPELVQPIAQIQMQPCWAVMASFPLPLTEDWVGAFIHDSILTWAARNGTKPGRPNDAEHLVLHAHHQWTVENWELDAAEVARELLAAFWQASGIKPQTATHLQAHRWKFAIPVDPPADHCYATEAAQVVACGDWAGGPRVEGAFLSGMAAAGRVLGTLRPKQQSRQTRLF